jgi:hypothetical protein
MPFVLTVIAKAMERNPYAHKYKKFYEVYQAVGSEEVQLTCVWIASDDHHKIICQQAQCINCSLNLFSVQFSDFFSSLHS